MFTKKTQFESSNKLIQIDFNFNVIAPSNCVTSIWKCDKEMFYKKFNIKSLYIN